MTFLNLKTLVTFGTGNGCLNHSNFKCNLLITAVKYQSPILLSNKTFSCQYHVLVSTIYLLLDAIIPNF